MLNIKTTDFENNMTQVHQIIFGQVERVLFSMADHLIMHIQWLQYLLLSMSLHRILLC